METCPRFGFGPLVDCHAHLYNPEFSTEDIEVAIREAAEHDVVAIMTVPECVSDAETVLALSRRHPQIKPFAGLHPVQKDHKGTPQEAKRSVRRDEIDELVRFVRSHHTELVGVGECGLDYLPRWCSEADKEDQALVLEAQVQLAREFDLPLNVHSRSAGRQTIELLLKLNARHVLLHAFDGRPGKAKPALDAGFYFSIAPSFCKGDRDSMITAIPIGQLLLESDSPALAFNKGEINYPKNVNVSLRELARIRRETPQSLAEETTRNAKRLFPKAFRE